MPETPETPELPDWRATEAAMWGSMRGRSMPPGSPAARAQQLIDQAVTIPPGPRRVTLARQALEAWPDCAEAYVLLAENSGSRKESLKLFEQGVAAGERALGPDFFRDNVGHFWGILETRPYMRARLGLAFSLWSAARRNEAVEHLRELLRLNPGDNQGVRYTLAGFLLFLDRDDDLDALLRQFPDEGSATWKYTHALLAFRKHGDTPESRQLLERAKRANQYVPDYLLGRKFPPEERPDYYSPGHESEAIEYLSGFMVCWKDTPGAIHWVRVNDEQYRKRKAEEPAPKGPLSFIKKWLRDKLPQGEDIWQANARRTGKGIRLAGDKVRPTITVVGSLNEDLLLASEVSVETPTEARLWDTLVQAMQEPAAGEPHRPRAVQVQRGSAWEALGPHLEEIGVRMLVVDDLEWLAAVMQGLDESLSGKPEPGLLDAPGVTPEQGAGFFAAAAAFFRDAPWKKVGYESAIRIDSAKSPGEAWYGVLMGQSGIQKGLALYEDIGALNAMWESPRSDDENARKSVSLAVLYGDEFELPSRDLEAAEKYGWEVTREDAYPWAMMKQRGMAHRPPLGWELELLEGCMRAVPEFVRRRRQDDYTPEEFTVPTALGELKLTLAWVPGGDD